MCTGALPPFFPPRSVGSEHNRKTICPPPREQGRHRGISFFFFFPSLPPSSVRDDDNPGSCPYFFFFFFFPQQGPDRKWVAEKAPSLSPFSPSEESARCWLVLDCVFFFFFFFFLWWQGAARSFFPSFPLRDIFSAFSQGVGSFRRSFSFFSFP